MDEKKIKNGNLVKPTFINTGVPLKKRIFVFVSDEV